MKIKEGLKLSAMVSLIVGLLFSSGLFSVLLYADITDKELAMLARKPHAEIVHADGVDAAIQSKDEIPVQQEKPAFIKVKAARFTVPAISQYPELPAGCEITSLTMLLQYYGVNKGKMELVPEMKVDDTEIIWGTGGKIKYWGNPHSGFVGDITRKSIGFGIYHTALFELLQKYVPSAEDLTESPFDVLEQQIQKGIPVVVWTTINFKVPDRWVEWDTPVGPIRTTFSEHAVLLVGYDENHVYVNDPLSGQQNLQLAKEQFIATWEAMGKQALSYNEFR